MSDDVLREVLPNGMTVLARQDSSAPVVAVLTWVRSGYFHEDDEQVGIAHVAEHMYFNGTTRRPGAEDIAREIKSLGGELNASTTYDNTSYHVTLPASALEQALDIQADAFGAPLLSPEVLRHEMGAVVQEAKRKLDTPSAVARETMYALSHDVHRIRRWRIGTEEQLRAYTSETVRRWWDDHYHASNAILAIVGDVDPRRAIDLAAERFASIPAGTTRRAAGPKEPAGAPALRVSRLTGDVRQATFVMGFRTVPELHPDAPALEVLSSVLSDGRSSRLVAELREKRRLVMGIGTSSHQIEDVGLFEIEAELQPEDLDAFRTALFEEIGRAWREEPSRTELARVRRRLLAGWIFSRSSMLSQARQLAAWEAMGGTNLADEWIRDVLAVEPDAVAAVAARYLVPEAAAIVEHVPERDGVSVAPSPARLQSALEAAAGEHPTARVSRAKPAAPSPVLQVFRASTSPGPWETIELEHATLVHRRLDGLPTVGVVAMRLGGRTGERLAVAGVTQLMASLLVRGTAARDAATIAGDIEGLGSSLRPFVQDEAWGIASALLSEDLEAGASQLLECLLAPTFPEDELAKALSLQQQRRAALQDQPLSWAVALARRAAYGSHPMGLPDLGTEDSLAALDRTAVAASHAAGSAGRLTIVVVGSVDSARAADAIASRLDDERASHGRAEEPAAVFIEGQSIVEQRRREQTSQVIAFPGVPASHADAPVLDVIAAFTSSLGGRFFEEVRTRRGLAYVVGSGSSVRRTSGHFAAWLSTSPADEVEAREVLLEEVRRVAREPARGEELQRAKAYLRGSHALAQQGSVSQAGRAAAWIALGAGLAGMDAWPDRIDAVTSDDVARVAGELLDPARATWAAVRGAATPG